jgi:hypothetical protein
LGKIASFFWNDPSPKVVDTEPGEVNDECKPIFNAD